MDKNEYRVKLDEINTLVDRQDYESALKIVEQIDWRRVKSARTLCMVGEIYEANKMYEKSRQLLLMAYDRAPIGKTVLYHLVELAIKMGDLDDAVDYYHEFAAASPNDNNKYILKYKIYRARKSPIKDQIAILEEYKEREYTERWAYELARLYAKAGMREKCIEECDDLILWFSEGRFVTKAMELKMTYTPLSPSQMEEYQGRFDTKPLASAFGLETEDAMAANPVAANDTVKDEKETGADKEQEVKAEETAVQETLIPEVPREAAEDLQDKIAQSLRDVFAGSEAQKPGEYLTSAIKNASVPQEAVVVPEVTPFVLPEEFKTEDSTKEKRLVAGEINMADYDVDIDAIIAETTGDLTAVMREIERMEKEEQAASGDVSEDAEKKELTEEELLQMELAAAVNAMMNDEELPQEETVQEVIPEKVSIEKVSEEAVSAEEAAVEEISEEEVPEEKELTEEEVLQLELAAAVSAVMNGEELPQEEVVEEAQEEELSQEAVLEEEKAAADRVPEFSGPEEESEEEDLGITKAFDLEAQIMKSLDESEKEAGKAAEVKVQEATPVSLPPKKEFRHHLTEDEQKGLFTYFARIPGMREQLMELLDIVQESACEKTSRNGNFIVVGRPGTGKSHLSECIIKAICKERRMEAAKIAYIDAEDLNDKDPAAVVAKLSGGFLVIEQAGDMDTKTAQKLTQAMEFKTNGLIIVLEDEKQPMKELLQDFPKLAEKFGATITVPVFTNDELVSFAKIYAHELGYHMDELGVLALYTLIGDNQKETEPVTVGQVKEMMDSAIYRSQKGGRKLGRKISNRLTDDQNRIILYEKDFDM